MKHYIFQHRIAIIAILIILLSMAAGIKIICHDSDTRLKSSLLEWTDDFNKKHYTALGDTTNTSLMKALRKSEDNDSLFYINLRQFSRNMFVRGEQVLAFEYLKNCMSLMDAEPNPDKNLLSFKSYAFLLLGAATDEVGLTSLSQDYYFKGLKIADRLEDRKAKSDFYNNIGVSYLRNEQKERAMEFFDKAMEIAVADKNDYLLYIIHYNISEVCADNKDFSGAIDHILKGIQYIDAEAATDDYYSMQSALGELYLRNGQLHLAYTYLSNAYKNQEKGSNRFFLFNTSMRLVEYFTEAAMPDSVAKYNRVAKEITTSTKNTEQQIRLLKEEAESEAAKGNDHKAYELSNRIMELKDSLSKEENTLRIEQAHNIYTLEKETEKRASGIRSWNPVTLFISMSCLMAVLAWIMVWAIMRKRRNDNANRKKTEAATTLSRHLQDQLRQEIDQKRQANEELRHYHQKLTSFTLDRIHLSQHVDELSTDIKRLLLKVSPRDKEQKEALKGILAKLTNLNTDTQWEEFQYYFEKVHPDFYRRLEAAHPGLTANDRRLCALISLGLSTKEIASLTFREVRSVESSRNRLRKKLEIETDKGLFEYMRGLGPSLTTDS